jgi:hypothetical protein
VAALAVSRSRENAARIAEAFVLAVAVLLCLGTGVCVGGFGFVAVVEGGGAGAGLGASRVPRVKEAKGMFFCLPREESTRMLSNSTRPWLPSSSSSSSS